MRVGDLLRDKPQSLVTVEGHDEVAKAVRLLMEHGIGALPVLDQEGRLIGLLSERDVVGAVDLNPDTLRQTSHSSVARIMKEPAPTCTADESLQIVMMRMTRERARHLVVVEAEHPIGVISV